VNPPIHPPPPNTHALSLSLTYLRDLPRLVVAPEQRDVLWVPCLEAQQQRQRLHLMCVRGCV
jgi:hypothetical protein